MERMELKRVSTSTQGAYEAFIHLNDDEGGKFLEERDTSIIEKEDLDAFFKGIAKESMEFGEQVETFC
jgi:hypothetical protein